MIRAEVVVPLLNANEPEARLVAIHVQDGQAVEKGALLCTLETTKAAADVEAAQAGFVRFLARQGDTLSVGDRLAVITESAVEPIEGLERGVSTEQLLKQSRPSNLRITRPAEALAKRLGIDTSALPTDRLVTETVVRQFAVSLESGKIDRQIQTHQPSSAKGNVSGKLVIYGGGGHAKAVLEMAQAIGSFEIAGIIDDKIPLGTLVLGVPILGGREKLPEIYEGGVHLAANGVGGIIDIDIRVRLFELLEDWGFTLPGLIHPRSTVEQSAEVGYGVQIFANAYIGSSAKLQPKCMVNTGAIVSHDCEIGAYTHIAPGALLAGHVQVGERTLVGMGVTTAIGIKVGDGARIGNGAILYADVPNKAIIPAGKVWAGQ